METTGLKRRSTKFLNSKEFWWFIAFIGVVIFFMYVTDPKTPVVDYVGYDDEGNPEPWNTRQTEI